MKKELQLEIFAKKSKLRKDVWKVLNKPKTASEIAKDKGYANFFMKKMGYPTIEGKVFYSDYWSKAIGSDQDIDSAYLYAKKLGFPVIVKPNDGSRGVGVALVHNKENFYVSMRFIFKHHRVAMVEKYIKGEDYRIVVLDKKIISAYRRIPLSITGDGISSIKKLLELKQKHFDSNGRDTLIKINDQRILQKLRQEGLGLKSVPEDGQCLYLLDNANLSSGGDSVDVTEIIHKKFKEIAIKLTRDMGLRLCGVDLMIDGDITKAPKKFSVLEINSAPGLDHYATTGPAQDKIVEKMYLEVLKSMEK